MEENYLSSNRDDDETFSKGELTRQSVIGKRAVPKPSKDFFEKVLDLELKLKRKFDILVLQQLVKFYTTAIEYYESINDPHYKTFQNNLNLLFAHPGILKMTQNRNENQVNPFINNESNNNKIKKEQEKKEIMKKIEYKNRINKLSNHNKEDIADLIKSSEITNNLKDLIKDDITKQQDDFKKKLMEKRRKSAFSEYGDNSLNLSKIINSSTTDLKFLNSTDLKSEISEIVCKESEDIIDGKPKNEKFIENFELFSPNLEDSKIDDLDELLLKGGVRSFRLFSNKQKDLIQNINENVDDFITEYNKFFFNNFFSEGFNQMEKMIDENNEKKNTIVINYTEQINEMDKLLFSDSEDQYRETIQSLINSLKEEQNLELEKTQDEFNINLADYNNKLKHHNIREDKEIQILEEKFKYNIFNSIGNMFNLKNKK